MYPGKPCFYLRDNFLGCSEYVDRPKDPCIDYRCVWLEDETFPAGAKPSVSGFLVTKRTTFLPGDDGMQKSCYYDVRCASSKIDTDLLEEVFSWMNSKNSKVNSDILL